MILDLADPDGLAQLCTEALLIKAPPLLAELLLPAVGLALQLTPLPYEAISVYFWLPVIRPKAGAQEGSLKLPAPATAAIWFIPGPGLLLSEGLLPVLQVGLQLQ